jgi:hypothetical protein
MNTLLPNSVYHCNLGGVGSTFIYSTSGILRNNAYISIIVPPTDPDYLDASTSWTAVSFGSEIANKSTFLCHIDDLPNYPEYLL